MKLIAWLDELSNKDVNLAGGKGASLGEMWNAGLPVPPAFVVTAEAYRYFIKETKLDEKIRETLKGIDVNNTDDLKERSKKARDLITTAKMPKDLELSIIESYNRLCEIDGGGEIFVAVRSSATAEDLPNASFAGQQDTYLNIKGADNVVNAVQRCFASLFTPRAVFYREQEGFDHFQVALAAVVQKMVNADKAGVMFTVNPMNQNYNEMVIEGAWGLGEGVVSGIVSPDTYIIDKTNLSIKNIYIAKKKTMFVKDENGDTKEIPVPEDMQEKRVLSDEDIKNLAEKGILIEKHYKRPMDIEWALENGKVYMLQARPITTLNKEKKKEAEKTEEEIEAKILLKGIGASPGVASGKVKILHDIEEIDKIKDGDILVTGMTTPDMVPAMKKASAIITDDGGLTCHAAIISRELGTPCVVGTQRATEILKDGMIVTVDGEKGIVYEGEIKKKEETAPAQVVVAGAPIITATEIKVNVSMPEVAERAAATGADGVGLLRAEHMILGTGVHPIKVLEEKGEDALVNIFAEGIRKVADAFYPRPVTYRTLDAPTDEFRGLKGGEDEPEEHNPMMGWRGIRRGLDQSEILRCELLAIKKLREDGYKNINIMIPLVTSPDEVKEVKKLAHKIGLELGKDIEFGIMVETPAAALIIEDFIKEGINFVSLGTNDLTQYTIAIDRNNEFVAKYYRENHPAVLKLVESVIKTCKKYGVKTSICGQAGSRPAIVEKLVEWGITSISANIDAIDTIRKTVARTEQRVILDAIRNKKNNNYKMALIIFYFFKTFLKIKRGC
ncbi:phosphoenolpyruvate synthase [Methanothermococcus okinawensis]|uniref:Phosphoenolpyruvate synthase n=1 Tax=Methanothermococcus okinawensis (strain DSM 14208 / JCM 11175 / IH1) TaxID=647113 RepID=F8ALI4_METOI|nr:phosphoenolpyruvate synthase [Methanothermococcus okinawensis]AEH07066.1 phosphoenolpyruvate synthase [Methanothermococcus okinawensis IH1]